MGQGPIFSRMFVSLLPATLVRTTFWPSIWKSTLSPAERPNCSRTSFGMVTCPFSLRLDVPALISLLISKEFFRFKFYRLLDLWRLRPYLILDLANGFAFQIAHLQEEVGESATAFRCGEELSDRAFTSVHKPQHAAHC